MALILLLLLIAFSSAPAGAQPARTVRVRLFEAFPAIRSIRILGRFRINFNTPELAGPAVVSIKNGKIFVLPEGKPADSTAFSARWLTISGFSKPVTVQYPGRSAKRYEGLIEISQDSGFLRCVNVVGLEEYVACVVGSETLFGWPMQMLQAQAILVQTRLARHHGDEVIGDSTQCQAYLGHDYARPLVRQAVRSVWGKQLTYAGKPVEVYYHSTCAGCTSNAAVYFGKPDMDRTYLRGVKCSYCKGSPFWKETVSTIPKPVFEGACGKGVPEVIQIDHCGRPLLLRTGSGATVTGYKFWLLVGQKLGWDKMPGTRYRLRALKNGDIALASTGAGHGVGMCQWGAAELAKSGKSFRDILAFYFPGTQVN